MGIMDTLKAGLAPARAKFADLAHRHGHRVEAGWEKAARTVDHRAEGTDSEKIESGTGKAEESWGRLAHKDDGTREGGKGAPPPAS
ncbi:Rv0909 family putative TA system antitoxin [Streptomyces pacificus]|uniref:Antitoxin n=1 Tax=Streptomyces pacificus TaxID=2705029 RepID=A0A6A0B2H3_9ACTN|nr:Rv0909 family putative TA system antitoxin [Streptomyces pacificus]GFH39332.1 antitoxin [Streptomyces pacificus]